MQKDLKRNPLGSPKGAAELLDMYFLDMRSALLEVAATLDRIERVGYDGGLIISPENSIPYDAPLTNVLAVYETVNNLVLG